MDGRELKAYERFKEQAQFYRARTYDLEADLRVLGPANYRANQKISDLQERVATLSAENTRLKQRVAELTLAAKQNPTSNRTATPLVKPPAPFAGGKRPGRKAGHPAALRAMPDHIDVHEQVPLPTDSSGRESCPHCKSCLMDVQERERVVEDIIPAKVVVTCYHTRSGFCPNCRKQVESAAPPSSRRRRTCRMRNWGSTYCRRAWCCGSRSVFPSIR